jgi:plastocyanin
MNGRWRVATGTVRVTSLGVAAIVILALVAPAARADDNQVVIRDSGFDPTTLTVHVGDSVTWTNDSSEAVEVITDDASLSGGQVAPGATFAHAFDAPGTVTYYVGGNPRLRATIEVEDPAAASGGTGPLVMVGVAVLAVVAVGAAIVTLIGAAGRQRRGSPPQP